MSWRAFRQPEPPGSLSRDAVFRLQEARMRRQAWVAVSVITVILLAVGGYVFGLGVGFVGDGHPSALSQAGYILLGLLIMFSSIIPPVALFSVWWWEHL